MCPRAPATTLQPCCARLEKSRTRKALTPPPGSARMRRPALAFALVLSLVAAGCARPDDVAPASVAEQSLGENVSVVTRANATVPANATCCIPDDPDRPGASPPPESLPRRVPFALPVELPIVGSIGAGEPNIAVLPDGTLFVTSPTGLQMKPNALEGAAYLWRSTDGGATWETLRGPETSPVGLGAFCSCDADVIASPDGTIYFSDWWNGNYMVEASTDGGGSWSSAPFVTR